MSLGRRVPALAGSVVLGAVLTSGPVAFGASAAAGESAASTPASDSPAALDHPGATIYRRACATCHDEPESERVPDLAALKTLNAETLRLAMTEGLMRVQGGGLSRRELAVLIDYLARREADDPGWYSQIMCGGARSVVAGDGTENTVRSATEGTASGLGKVVMAGVGVDGRSRRFLDADSAGLAGRDLARLTLAWAIGFPDTDTLRGAPVILGDTLFYAAGQTGRVLAIETTAPCVRWVYDAGVRIATSLGHGRLGPERTPALLFGDRAGRVHAISAVDGSRLWMAEGRHAPDGGLSGAPVVHGDRVIVPVSGSGVGRGADPEYECCSAHGAVVALDGATGARLWVYHTTAEATYNGRLNRVGVRQKGPSGAPVWSTPTVDARRGVVYATTGQNTSLPATDTSDAVLALDLETGGLRWGFQALANDVWIIGCRDTPERSTPNCPDPADSVLKDFDFGGAAVLVARDEGRELLLAGQKSGHVWALDPDSGEPVWNQRFGQGTPLGGVHWGLAVDERRVYAAINDPVSRAGRGEPGLNALDIDTGEVIWRAPLAPSCGSGRSDRFPACASRYGLSAVPLVVDGAVIAGAVDGRLFVYAAEDGAVLLEYDTLRAFDTVNGVPGRGGSIDAHSVAAGLGMVFVGSGYGRFGQAAGNVLLAFRPTTE